MKTNTSSIETKQQIISPKFASEIMERHHKRMASGEFNQRPITESVVQKYANEMRLGNWKLSPEPIIFDVNGDLMNGQHRLEAVCRANKDIPFTISTGWPIEEVDHAGIRLMDVLDTGKGRNVAQMMAVRGIKNSQEYSATARHIARLCTAASQSPQLTVSTTMFMLDNLDMKKHIDKIVSMGQAKVDFHARVIGPLAYYHTSHPTKAEKFAEDLFNHTTEKGTAIHAYFKWTGLRSSIPTHDHLMGMCHCIKSYHNDFPLTVIRPYPEAVEWLADTNKKLREQIRQLVPRQAK